MKNLSKEELLRKLEKRDEQIAHLRQENERLQQEVGLLNQKVDLLVRRIYGTSSEKLPNGQMDLFLLNEEEAREKEQLANLLLETGLEEKAASRKNLKEKNARYAEDLPVEETILDPLEVQADRESYRLIGEEVSEQLDYEPGRFFRRRLVRRKYVRRTEAEAVPVIAPLPPVLQERCVAAPGLLAAVIVGKYCDHLPLYRQEKIFESRHDVYLPRASLARWMGLSADWLHPIYEHIRAAVMKGGYVQVDETPISYLAPGHGKTKLGYLWTAHSPGGDTFYQWETSRGAHCLEKVMAADFEGHVQCDGYAAYASFAKDKEEIALVACWAHARRYFYEALEQVPLQATWILRQMGWLYRIEKILRESRAGPAQRQAIRAWQSTPIYQRLHRAIVRLKASARYLPRSAFGKALDYALANWPQLGVYLQEGHLEIDNNLVENAIRPTAIGKKNWLFFGDAQAGKRSAILYTIVESCRRRGIDPYHYLRDVLTRLPTATNWTVGELTPENWAKNHCKKPTRTAA